MFNGFFDSQFKTADVLAFMRQYDWGTAPIIGGVYTVDASNVGSLVTDNAFAIFTSQVAEANGGWQTLTIE